MKNSNKRLIVVCYNVVKGGGVSLVFSFIEFLIKKEDHVVILCPKNKLYKEFIYKKKLNNKYWKIHFFPIWCNVIILKPLINYLFLPVYVYINKSEKVFNFGNVAFPSFSKSFLLMHNAFAVSDDRDLLKRFSFVERMRQELMSKFIIKNIKFATKVGVQTTTIRNQLLQKTKIVSDVIPNISISEKLINLNVETPEFNPEKINLIFLSKYYPHKNFEILILVGKLIIQKKMNITISITLDGFDKNENIFLKKIKDAHLGNVIVNIGFVKIDELKNVYLKHDGLFLPSLLESYSGTFIEAIVFKRPIFTSNRPFSREVCGDGAFYFDPLDPEDIINTIQKAFSDTDCLKLIVNNNLSNFKKKMLEKDSMSEIIYKKLT